MGQVLALALQSMQHDMKRAERIAANMANTLTPGYKRDVVIERPFSELITDQSDNGVASAAVDPGMQGLDIVKDNRPGSLKPTGQKLDVALSGEGYFEIATANGVAYTRQGSFQVDARGRLVTLQGDAVMGKNGEIVLNSNQVLIDASGKIFDTNLTNVSGQIGENVIAQLKIMKFEIEKVGRQNNQGMLVADSDAILTEVKNPQIMQGHLENSNVSSMEEMVHLMQTMRHFESMQRVAQGYDEMMGAVIKKLGESS